jgi:hypothetical protein
MANFQHKTFIKYDDWYTPFFYYLVKIILDKWTMKNESIVIRDFRENKK